MKNHGTENLNQDNQYKDAKTQEYGHGNIAGIIMRIIFQESQRFYHRVL